MIHLVEAAQGPWLHWTSLHLSPVALNLAGFELRWYALSYLAMILLGWWYLGKLVAQPGAPLSQPLDDLAGFIMIGVIVGGRLGYATFYQPELWLHPIELLKLWNGGMAFHGGFIGVLVALGWFARSRKIDFIRLCDYIACAAPFGLFLVRIANFVNGELYGRPTRVPWAMIFPGTDGQPRHPSQLYEAGLEGLLIGAVLWFLFWKTDARYRRGRLAGTALAMYGLFRFLLEMLRQPDKGLEHLWWGLTMGQTLSLPMLVAGLYLLWRSFRAPPVHEEAGPAAISSTP